MRRGLSQKILIFSLFALLFLVLAGFGIYKKYFSGIAPAIFAPPEDITRYFPEDSVPPEVVNETNFPLKLPAGFVISIFAKNLPGARVLKFDNSGNLWLSRTSQGVVTKIEIKDGRTVDISDFFKNLRKPHGLVFDQENSDVIYIAEENAVSKFNLATGKKIEKLLDLPYGDGHFTRTIGLGPDGKLYISVGSSCDVCNEKDERRASIIQYDLNTREQKIFAKGLRNAVFFIWSESGEKMWATEMGRDWLGDDLPPDEINIIREPSIGSGQNSIPNFGWPNCYGKNIHDAVFDPVRNKTLQASADKPSAGRISNGVDKNTYIRNPCLEQLATPSFIDVPAHSAPLGLAFIPAAPSGRRHERASPQAGALSSGAGREGYWPEDYWYDLLIAYHGSWNRSRPTGYKVVRHKFDENGNYQGVEDFITGWLVPEGALGRPVDMVFDSNGNAYISDDKAGVIYRVTYVDGKRKE